MQNRSELLEEFEAACHDLAEARAAQLLDLSDSELEEVAEGLARLDDPVRAACQVVLNDWAALDACARVAALLVFANALVEASE